MYRSILAGVGIAIAVALGLALASSGSNASETRPSSINSVVHGQGQPNGTATVVSG
jgi:hypothetical protein